MKKELSQLPQLKRIAIIGASGFIGQHFVKELTKQRNLEIRVLVHQTPIHCQGEIIFIEGDLLELSSLDDLLCEDSIVVNLAYLPSHNLQAMENLATACQKNRVKRLIHCSTAVVVGNDQRDIICEEAICRPTSKYQISKLSSENFLLEFAKDRFEIAILRPTAVFGIGGKNLIKLANHLITGSMLLNYIKSCLFGRRSMNLVCVENVVAALIFMLDSTNIDREVFIISDDDAIINNYRDVEDRILAFCGKSYCVPRVPVPKFILTALLKMMGKLSIATHAKFSDKKLSELGYVKPQKFDQALLTFAEKCNSLESSQAK